MTLRSRKLKPVARARWYEGQSVQAHLAAIDEKMETLTKAEMLFSEILASAEAQGHSETAPVPYTETAFDRRQRLPMPPKKKRAHPFQKC